MHIYKIKWDNRNVLFLSSLTDFMEKSEGVGSEDINFIEMMTRLRSAFIAKIHEAELLVAEKTHESVVGHKVYFTYIPVVNSIVFFFQNGDTAHVVSKIALELFDEKYKQFKLWGENDV